MTHRALPHDRAARPRATARPDVRRGLAVARRAKDLRPIARNRRCSRPTASQAKRPDLIRSCRWRLSIACCDGGNIHTCPGSVSSVIRDHCRRKNLQHRSACRPPRARDYNGLRPYRIRVSSEELPLCRAGFGFTRRNADIVAPYPSGSAAWAKRCSSAFFCFVGGAALWAMLGFVDRARVAGQSAVCRNHRLGDCQAHRRGRTMATGRAIGPRSKSSTGVDGRNYRDVDLRHYRHSIGQPRAGAGQARSVRSRRELSLLVRSDGSLAGRAGARLQRLVVPGAVGADFVHCDFDPPAGADLAQLGHFDRAPGGDEQAGGRVRSVRRHHTRLAARRAVGRQLDQQPRHAVGVSAADRRRPRAGCCSPCWRRAWFGTAWRRCSW